MFSKGAGSRGGSSKDTNRVQQKSANRHSSTSDSGLPTNELIELKNILALFFVSDMTDTYGTSHGRGSLIASSSRVGGRPINTESHLSNM
jgi:hypothetical protein